YARRSSDLNPELPKTARTAGKGVRFPGPPGGITAEFSRRPSSVSAGVLTARETAVHTDWLGLSVQSKRAFGSTSNPVKLLRSNFEPRVNFSRLSTRLRSEEH